MARYIQVQNGLVKHVWDSPPPVPVGEDGWMNAVENIPQLTSRQEYGDFTYDISVDPAIISREVCDIKFEVTKQRMLDDNIQNYRQFIEHVTNAPTLFDNELIVANRDTSKKNEDLINSANNYDELDKVVISQLRLY